MKSDKSSEYTRPPSQLTKQDISSAFEQLTRSEIDALRQKKRHISACYQKVIEAHIKQRLSSV